MEVWSKNASQPDLQPAPRALGRVVRIECPRDQDRGERARGERGRGRAHDRLRHGVPAQAAVTEEVCVFGRDDIRRVGDDQVELLALDRLEEAAAPELDVAHAVERCVELRVLERSRVHVRRHDVPRVRGKKDRLDPVAGAHVERSLARTTVRCARATDGRWTPGTWSACTSLVPA